ncbi:homoserine O-acetyltransferase MetX [Nocardioides daeguensis]|uniref:Homoserine O-succinyltransferase n=1 Tax=Nocardioides daeguensis TaxID=908359 RepID=A0ABP6VP40_9ACTN|nr:homoserine O-acetyltransferase [Nocardioides daeguensis]MBV6727369.1 homoserine O-acetyltransferase [Nocardioides daeguensis]MCR1775458.1 homoserine O-acetyltransferase [Nocardioides daeguensis]
MGTIGYVETQRVVLATECDPLVLTSGAVLEHVEVAYETYGVLNEARDNAVMVCHALTGDAHAAGLHLGAKKRGWWDNLIGPGKAVDTDRFFVVSANLLGGCSGTTGPASIDPATGRVHGPDFPLLDMADFVAVHRRLLDHLGIGRLHAAVGGSLGGMQVLEWALEEPDRIDRAVVVAASSRLTTENIAFSAVARAAILEDPDFHGGRYAEHGVAPRHGLKVARMMAHVTYVSGQSLAEKFGHARDTSGTGKRLAADFEVEHYLQHQGESFLQRFDALSYLHLTRPMDYFDPFAAHPDVVPSTRFRLVSFDSDWRFPTAHSLRIRDQLLARGVAVDHTEVVSPWGHDSFLLEPPGYHDLVRSFLG